MRIAATIKNPSALMVPPLIASSHKHFKKEPKHYFPAQRQPSTAPYSVSAGRLCYASFKH
jgi:hypothetical protein